MGLSLTITLDVIEDIRRLCVLASRCETGRCGPFCQCDKVQISDLACSILTELRRLTSLQDQSKVSRPLVGLDNQIHSNPPPGYLGHEE